ncbi:IclR family transcriptional regulator [Paenibacillus sp. HB172176]|uniref:IclR family transcriptional regulator n=1 Tax=Paenibacillus sp. HB172176 TaxID=2493690 RepID=UPI00143A6219|nr:IclR family transcriptional regulator [Paenibacillus sp. HB172176]
MERKYWVPALERADKVLACIAESPSELKLMDLSAATGINKSTMFSLLQTMEAMNWISREKGDTYRLGSVFGMLGHAYFKGFDLVELFQTASSEAVGIVGETLQLAKLEGRDILYLAKKESLSPVRMITEPGMRLPAYSTALGKALLSVMNDEAVASLFGDTPFHAFTEQTTKDVLQLLEELRLVREQGYALDEEEAVVGFTCVAAPIYERGEAVAAASFSMPTHCFREKNELAIRELRKLTKQLSR